MTAPPEVSYTWIDSQSHLEKFIEGALGHEKYFLDTEFHREKTYFPQLALVQISVDDRIFLIDPLAVDASQLSKLFESPALCVLHAAQQDLDVLSQSIGAIPQRIFDTQIAAGFLGFSQPSLASLLQTFLKITVGKNDRLSDWLHRPLSRDQLNYAASDVAYLPELSGMLVEQLAQRERIDWVNEACEELRTRPTGPTSVDAAWLKVKDIRSVKGRGRWIAQSVARWRETRAMALDLPPRHVLSDIAVLGIAQKPPRTLDDMAKIRGVDQRHVTGTHGQALLTAVHDGVKASQTGDLHFPSSDSEDVDKSLRSAVTLVSAWIAELARISSLDVGILATRKDIVELLSGSAQARLSQGWRADIVGRDIEELVSGKKALTFSSGLSGQGLRLISCPEPNE